jgi:hypothetical protein
VQTHAAVCTSQAVSRQIPALPSCACSAAAVRQRPFLAGRSLQQRRLVSQPRTAPTRRQVGRPISDMPDLFAVVEQRWQFFGPCSSLPS